MNRRDIARTRQALGAALFGTKPADLPVECPTIFKLSVNRKTAAVPGRTIPQSVAAVFVDKILKGAGPANISVKQPTRFERVINLRIAKALGITIPQTLLLRADEVVQ